MLSKCNIFDIGAQRKILGKVKFRFHTGVSTSIYWQNFESSVWVTMYGSTDRPID